MRHNQCSGSTSPITSPRYYTKSTGLSPGAHRHCTFLNLTGLILIDTTSTPKMEALPSELKLQILCYVDFRALRALVHASPAYHAIYQASREKILTRVTLHSLRVKLCLPSQWPAKRHPYHACQTSFTMSKFLFLLLLPPLL